MAERRFLRVLGLAVIGWAVFFLAFTWVVDPYGVSTLGFTRPHFNAFKPKRVDIDRVLKPYEVWRYQPRTVFLGTSRVQQSIDPAVLDGTRFASAYNAAIPASSLAMTFRHLEHYLELDPNLRTVVIELFLWNFLTPARGGATAQPDNPPPLTRTDLIRDMVALSASSSTVWDSLWTVAYNVFRRRPPLEIKPRGFLSYPPDYDAKGSFDGFAAGVWAFHPKQGQPLRLDESAFEWLPRMIDIARAHGVEVIFVVTPNHAYVDSYFDLVDAWPLIGEWLRRVSARATVYSFSQPNAWVYEPVRSGMSYWNDPFHFSIAMGGGIQARLAGMERPDLPLNFMIPMTGGDVAHHIENRRKAIGAWKRDNEAFVARLAEEQRKTLAEPGITARKR